jgi:hypothetical protein
MALRKVIFSRRQVVNHGITNTKRQALANAGSYPRLIKAVWYTSGDVCLTAYRYIKTAVMSD